MSELMLPEELKKEVLTMEEMTRTVAVNTPEQRGDVFRFIQAVKAKKKAIEDYFAEMKSAAHASWKKIVAAEKFETDKLDAFEAAAKKAIVEYDRIEADKAETERKRLQAIADEAARKERERAEQEAARQRAIEEEAKKKAEDARKAAETASAEERARLLKEAEASDRKAAAAAVKVEAKMEVAAAAIAPTVQIVTTVEKQKGEATQKTWKGKVINIQAVSVESFRILWGYFTETQRESAINAFARATKGNMPMTGIEFYSETSLKIGSR
jgi:hypothetical protein